MENIHNQLITLAKTTKYHNIFAAAKELNGIRLFKNMIEFSKLQELFLSYLFTFDMIQRDIIVDKISKHVLDDDTDIYLEAYLFWKNNHKDSDKETKSKSNYVHLVPTKEIKFKK